VVIINSLRRLEREMLQICGMNITDLSSSYFGASVLSSGGTVCQV